ncbi:MAG: hypothetical protein U5L11_15540 [Arhodomonas sp.]|nr:hypothetical protein [Arhodomonas sp.]
MIAGLPQGALGIEPHRQSGTGTRSGAIYVLGRMHELGMIDEPAYEEASAAPLTAEVHRCARMYDAALRGRGRAQPVSSSASARRRPTARGTGVYTTIDGERQAAARAAVRQALHGYDERHGWRGPVDTIELADGGTDAAARASASTGGFRADRGPGERGGDRGRRRGRGSGSSSTDREGRLGVAGGRRRSRARGQGDGPGGTGRRRHPAAPDREGPRLAQVPQPQGALVALAPEDGAVEALVGGRFDQLQVQPGATGPAPARLGVQAPDLLRGLENGLTPATLINDAPWSSTDPSLEDTWRPENYSREFYRAHPSARGADQLP